MTTERSVVIFQSRYSWFTVYDDNMKKKKNQTNKKIKKQIMKYIFKSKILRKIFKNTVLGIGMYNIGKFVVNKNAFK